MRAHDDAGNLIEREDASGQVTHYRHDAANRLLDRDYAGLLVNGTDALDAIYHYDEPAGLLDFGDGTQGTGATPVHTYQPRNDPPSSRDFPVRLMVTDAAGRSDNCQTTCTVTGLY